MGAKKKMLGTASYVILPKRPHLPKRPVTAWCRRALHDWAYDAAERASYSADCPRAEALLNLRNWLVIPRAEMYKLAQVEFDYQKEWWEKGYKPKVKPLDDSIWLPEGVTPVAPTPVPALDTGAVQDSSAELSALLSVDLDSAVSAESAVSDESEDSEV